MKLCEVCQNMSGCVNVSVSACVGCGTLNE